MQLCDAIQHAADVCFFIPCRQKHQNLHGRNTSEIVSCALILYSIRMPRVTFVVVNYNGGEYLKECYESICSQTYRDRELIVVDNASTDRSLEFLSDRNHVRLIRNETNRGFGAANNQAFAIAS